MTSNNKTNRTVGKNMDRITSVPLKRDDLNISY